VLVAAHCVEKGRSTMDACRHIDCGTLSGFSGLPVLSPRVAAARQPRAVVLNRFAVGWQNWCVTARAMHRAVGPTGLRPGNLTSMSRHRKEGPELCVSEIRALVDQLPDSTSRHRREGARTVCSGNLPPCGPTSISPKAPSQTPQTTRFAISCSLPGLGTLVVQASRLPKM
jgi:hypothetical protein